MVGYEARREDDQEDNFKGLWINKKSIGTDQ